MRAMNALCLNAVSLQRITTLARWIRDCIIRFYLPKNDNRLLLGGGVNSDMELATSE